MKTYLLIHLFCVTSVVWRYLKYNRRTVEWAMRRDTKGVFKDLEQYPEAVEDFVIRAAWILNLILGILFAPYHVLRRLFS